VSRVIPIKPPRRCRGAPIGDGNYTGCAFGDGGVPPFTEPCDCPICHGSGIEGGSEEPGYDLAEELQKIYDSEINVSISWLWDCGIDVWLGDELNGFLAGQSVQSTAAIVPWLQEAIAHFYPDSTYTRSLDSETRTRGRDRVFTGPQPGSSVRCPKCGARQTPPSRMDELFAFICAHCGAAVKVEPPTVQ
jgi:hypothetical protein